MDKFQNRYRIPSARLQTWDYGWNAAYFVTICTINRECYFGEIIEHKDAMHCVSGEMQLSEIGKIVEQEWLITFEMRPDMNLTMDVFVVMPNHFHAIIVIGKNEYNTEPDNKPEPQRRDAMHRVSTATTTNKPKNQFGPQRKNLASIMRGFKSAVTRDARPINPDFAWQVRFHDHIIRDNESHRRIQDYIINNPQNWDDDRFYKP